MSDLSIHPVYLSARAAIVSPERAIPLTIYATQKWLPRLGPERWCLVLLLRSLSIDSQRRSDGTKRVSCSWRHLSEMLDVHEETIASWLKHEPIPNDKPWRRIIPSGEKSKNLGLFVPRLRYAYETRNGKTRRIGFLLEILMEDPVVPEDEIRLKKQIDILQMQQGSLGLDTYRITEGVNYPQVELPLLSKIPHTQTSLGLHNVNPEGVELPNEANPLQLDLHNLRINPENSNLPTDVKQNNSELNSYVNSSGSGSVADKSEISGKNVNELDILIQQLKHNNIRKNPRRDDLAPIVQITENLLEDNHSTGMLYKVLGTLYPERMDLYVASVRVALDASKTDPKVNRGAVFVRTMRDFAEIAGIDLGLKKSSDEQNEDMILDGHPDSHQELTSQSALAPPSVTEAIWTETQLVLRRQMTQATFDAIIQGTVLLQGADNQYLIGVHSDMAKEWLENRLRDIVQRALSSVVGKSINVEFKLLNSLN